MIRINRQLIEKIRTHAVEAYPEECCGALTGVLARQGRIVHCVMPLENRDREDARRRFLVTADDYRRLDRLARSKEQEILGFYHSHPDHPPRPSEYDRQHALPWYAYFIVSVANRLPGNITCWTLADDRSRFEAQSFG